jgi:hypothetical protein
VEAFTTMQMQRFRTVSILSALEQAARRLTKLGPESSFRLSEKRHCLSSS